LNYGAKYFEEGKGKKNMAKNQFLRLLCAALLPTFAFGNQK